MAYRSLARGPARLALTFSLLWATGCAGSLQQQKSEDPPVLVHRESARTPAPPPPPPLPPRPAVKKVPKPKAIQIESKNIRGQAISVVRVDLRQVEPRFAFAYGTGKPLRKVESFYSMWRRSVDPVVVSGTFYGERTRETMGTIVSGGRVHQSPDWDNRGTALVVDRLGKARMVTLRAEGKPNPRECSFWLQSGPRLVRNKQIWYKPHYEGFRDPSLFSRARRMAVGLAGNGRTLLIVGFKEYPTLMESAKILRDLGVSDAMNLDGGPSAGLAVSGRLIMGPDSPLTHVLVMRPRAAGRAQAGSEIVLGNQGGPTVVQQ